MPSKTPTVAIVDYSLGNLFSVRNACERVGLRSLVTSNKQEILAADAVILPGVGAFGDAMDNLRRLDLISPLRDLALRDTPLIGICLGQQLLMSEGFEFGHHRGLGIFEGQVIRFEQPRGPDGTLKVPQVGWNRINRPVNPLAPVKDAWRDTPLDGLPDGAFMYFVHSYHVQPSAADVILSTTRYGHIEFCSSLRRGNVIAFQFHPERSGQQGLRIYQALMTMIANHALTQECAHAA